MESSKKPAAATRTANGDRPSFEQALAELETIVQKMESDNLPLDESLSCLKRGMELSALCNHSLKQAEQEVRCLVEQCDPMGLEPFVTAEDNGHKED